MGLTALAAPAAAAAADRNRDGLPDKWEKRYGLSLARDQAPRDQDRDGLRNRDEYKLGTNPRYRDTDNDLLRDGDELPTGHDPLDRDSDDDGIADGRENPGRVVTFADGVLTLRLASGEQVRALVTETTVISCEGPAPGGLGPAGDPPPDSDVADGNRVLARTDYDAAGTTDDPDPIADIGDPAANCGARDLEPGAVVREAGLRAGDDGTVGVESIALLRP